MILVLIFLILKENKLLGKKKLDFTLLMMDKNT